MNNLVQLIELVKAGAASLVIVKGAQIYVHIRRKTFCPNTGKEGPECRDVFSLMDIAQHYTNIKNQRVQLQAAETSIQEILEAAVSADREGAEA